MMFKSQILTSAMVVGMAWSTAAANAGACAERAAAGTCTIADALPAASLLQKGIRHAGKGIISDIVGSIVGTGQPAAPIEFCTGTEMQGRCWHLSEIGESCTASCAKYGRGFSYVVADSHDPVTPYLVGHIPKEKQEPWTALECYVPSEDRYHTANANAAKHFVDDIGSFAYADCKLACPCTLTLQEITTTAPTTVQPTEAPTYPKEDGCEWIAAYSCVKEFDFEDTHHIGCTATDGDHDTPWCSNADPYNGSWNNCIYSCPNKIDAELPEREGDEMCHWDMDANCSTTFTYKGKEYSSCTDADYPTPWCSLDRVHKGSWSTCSRVCTEPSGEQLRRQRSAAEIAAPDNNTAAVPAQCTGGQVWNACGSACTKTCEDPNPMCTRQCVARCECTSDRPVWRNGECISEVSCQAPTSPPTPSDDDLRGSEDPCTRHPDAENDILGASVTLDEPGYKVVSTASLSPINMKRFVCRVIEKLDCRVTNYADLMAFIPYYNGMEGQQSYKNLESELTTLCHAGGKWVVSK